MRFVLAILVLGLLAVPPVSASSHTGYVEYSGPLGEFSGERQIKIMDFVYLNGWDLGGAVGCIGAVATFHQFVLDQGSTVATIQAMSGDAKLYVNGVRVVSTLGPTVAEFPVASSQVHITVLFDFHSAPDRYAQVVAQLRGMASTEPAPCVTGPDTVQELNGEFKDSREAAREAYKAGKGSVAPSSLNDYNRAYQDTRLMSLELYKQAKEGLRAA